MLTKSTCLKFYKRKDIQEAIIEHAKNKEIGMQYGLGNFGKRPDILSYPRDVLELALQGVTSFHASEEVWSNPLSLNSSISKIELDDLRTGWDLVLDIDCKIMEYSRICADLIIKFLKYCEVKDISCKFSGNKGTKGRVALYEMLIMTPQLEEIIAGELNEVKIKEEAYRQGMITMKQDGVAKSLQGTISFEEMIRMVEE